MIPSRFLLVWVVASALCVGCADSKKGSSKKTAPAKVTKLPKETELATVKLTEKADSRLGIVTKPVTTESIRRYRHVNGEVVIPVGKSIVVSAPVTGTLRAPMTGVVPAVGSRVESGRKVFTLAPLLSPERYVPTPAERVAMANAKASILSLQILAEGDVKQSQARVEAANIAYQRAERLLKDRVGSARDRDDTLAVLEIAKRQLEAAEQRRDQLMKLKIDEETGRAKPIDLEAPRGGLVYRMLVAEGQTVSTGDPLFEVGDLDTVWVRTPIYVGEQSRLVADADADIRAINSDPKSRARPASPIPAPPTANALTATSDWYYSLDNRELGLRPGERVQVSIPMDEKEERLVVPWSAVIIDIYGGAWVYEETAKFEYVRRRVQVAFVKGDKAVLARGPKPSTSIVVEGVAELFGTEFDAGK